MAPCGAVPISLQPLTDAHLPGMEELVADAESVRYTPIPDPPPVTTTTLSLSPRSICPSADSPPSPCGRLCGNIVPH